MNVLVVEDDAPLRELLARGLREEGFDVRTAANGHEAMETTRGGGVDALVLDIGLPDADGRDLCQALRAEGYNAPVLFLTARDAMVDRLAGFRAGGDDYVVKPFEIAEVVARLDALLRRAGATETQRVGGLELDPVGHTVRGGDAVAELTPTEFRVLATLAARPGAAVRRAELVRAAWPDGAMVHDNTLDVYIARVRRKLRDLDGAPAIATVHGVGYRLE
jgi:two-component system OmpR family response regulator